MTHDPKAMLVLAAKAMWAADPLGRGYRGGWERYKSQAQAALNIFSAAAHQSAPAVTTSHNSGEGLPNSDAASAGAGTDTLIKQALAAAEGIHLLQDSMSLRRRTAEILRELVAAVRSVALPAIPAEPRCTWPCSCDETPHDGQQCEIHAPPSVPAELEHGQDGTFKSASLRTIIARAVLAAINNPIKIETIDWEIADAVIAAWPAPAVPGEVRKACPKCENTGWCHAQRRCELSGYAILAAMSQQPSGAVPVEVRERIARILYECEKKRGENADAVMKRISPKASDALLMEPWEECKGVFLSDADAILAALPHQPSNAKDIGHE